MATSTTTLLQAVNRVLLNLNERPIPDTTTLIGQKTVQALETALNDISEAQDWQFSEERLSSVTWSGNEVTLPDTVQRVEEVSYNSGTFGDIRILYVHPDNFTRYPSNSYSTGGRPIYWTHKDYNVVKVTPYPTSPTEQSKIFFRVQNRLTIPASDNATFGIPEQFISLLVRKASSLMARRHLEDEQLARAYEAEYLESLAQLKIKNSGRHVKYGSAYRDK